MSPIHLQVEVHDHGSSHDELDRSRNVLLADLRDFELESAEPLAAGRAPNGAKAAETITLAAIGIAVLPAVLPKLIEFLEHWTLRSKERALKIKIADGARSVQLELPMRQGRLENLSAVLELAQAHLARVGNAQSAMSEAEEK